MSVLAAKAAYMDPPMEAVSAARPQGSTLARVLRGLRPTAPAAFAGFALGLSFALMMPMAWLSAICWNLYLDKLHPIFIEPLGHAARIGVGIGLGVIAMLFAAAVVLALATPAGQAWLAHFRRPAPAHDFSEYAGLDEAAPSVPRRRSADIHPDAPQVAPINALRDLPAAGLRPMPMIDAANDMAMDEILPAIDATDDEMLELADFTDASSIAAVPESEDTSLGAMVARLEAGVMRQRGDGGEASPPPVDLALEAALSTLARMNQRAVG
ncbi:MAG: hypothetical protein H2056_03270 [Sphingopyxis sp.]|nr:hypothetical protein [Sphingopyxis sp.]